MRHRNRMARNKGKRMVKTAGKHKGQAEDRADLEAWATESEDDLLAAWDNLPMPDVEAEDDEKFRFGNGAKDRGMKAVSVRSSGRKEEL
jgi:hypothetical protein